MSRLFGPLSETISSVSWRDCAFAGDHTAGAAGRMLPAASAVIDLRNSRRFIIASARWCTEAVPQAPCQRRRARRDKLHGGRKCLSPLPFRRAAGGACGKPGRRVLHTIAEFRLIIGRTTDSIAAARCTLRCQAARPGTVFAECGRLSRRRCALASPIKLRLDDVSMAFATPAGPFEALVHVSLAVPSGRFVSL